MERGTTAPDRALAEEALAAGRFADVCDRFGKAPPSAPEDWLLLGRARLGRGQPAEARAAFEQGLRLAPAAPALHYYLGCALARSADWPAAETALARCLGDDVWRDRALRTRAQVRVRAGLWADAAADYGDLHGRGRLAPRDRLGLAARLVELGRWDEAAPLLDALAEGGGTELVWLLRGRCLEAQRRWPDAAGAYRRGLERAPESEALARRLLAVGRRPGARRPELVLLTHGSRQRLLAEWRRRQAERPDDLRLAHRLALLCTFGALKAQEIRSARARDLWQTALANWALLLESDAWKTNHAEERGRAYGRPATADDLALCGRHLEAQLDRALERARGDQAQVGAPSLREEYARERAACRAALAGGGLLLKGAAVPLACGPLLLTQLGRVAALAAQLRGSRDAEAPAWLAWPDPEGWEEPAANLRVLFSSLGFAQARLQADDPRGALESLRWAVCPACAAVVRRARPADLPVCRADCPDFERRNPGFADQPERGLRLSAAAEWLRLQAHVAVVNQALVVAEPDAAEVVKHWRAAADLLEGARRERLDEYLREAVLRRSRALMREDRRADLAAALLDAAASACADAAPFGAALAVALTDWGIDLANAGDPEAGADKLRQALARDPHAARTRANLVQALNAAGRKASARKDFAAAAAYLAEAEGLCRAEGHQPAELSDLAEDTVLTGAAILTDRAAADFDAGDAAAAASRLDEAYRKAAGTFIGEKARARAADMAEAVRGYLTAASVAAARAAEAAGDRPGAVAWLERACVADPHDPHLAEQLRLQRARLGGRR